MWNDRTKLLIGQSGLEKLEKSNVAVVGIGGVGGYVCEMLVRAGVGRLTIVDFDTIDETNINRQLVANTETVGLLKTEVMEKMLKKINPQCKIMVKNVQLSKENVGRIIGTEKYDFVVDAIDNVTNKIDLICFCKENGIKIVSAMGAGNRFGIPNFKVTDIYKTSNDGLARVLRKKLRERGVSSLDVVISEETAEKIDKKTMSVGSISYYPAMCGCVLSAYVVQNLLK